MTFLRLLFYGFVIFITATAFSADENRKDNIDKPITNKVKDHTHFVNAKNYDVKLIPYFKEDKERDDVYTIFKTEEYQANGRFVFYGEITAIIHIFQPTTKLRLSSSNSIRLLSGKLTPKSAVNIKPEDYYHYLAEKIEYNNITQTCDLHFKEELSRGNYTANIKFLNAFNISGDDNIFLKTTYIKKSKNIISWDETYFPMVEIQRVFPCWDNPTVRATFNVSIKHYCSYSVFSNMPIKEILKYKLNNTETCMQWTYFDTTPFIPAHLVMVMISSMHFFPNYGKDKIYIWRNPNSDDIQFAERVSDKVIMKFKFEWFKSLKTLKVKIPKLQLVAIPGFRNDINMNFGLVAIRETSIIYNENLHSVAHKIEAARLIARGIAYQWFNHLIIPTWWTNLWISDGLTTLFEMEAVNAVNALEHYTDSKLLDLLIVQTQYESLKLDDHNLTQPLMKETNSPPEINSLFSYSRSIKAPLILRMLQHVITKEVFWKSLYRYLVWHAAGSTTPHDFWILMEETVYRLSHSCPHPVALAATTTNNHLIDVWAKFANYPTLKITRNYNENRMYIEVENCDLFQNNQLQILITFTTQSNLNFASPFNDERLIYITSQHKHLDIEEDGWVMFNLQQAGYYRINYDPENWQRIAKYLNSEKYKKIHVLNRAKIIDDAFHFTLKQKLHSSIFWNLTNYLEHETNYIAWYPMIKIIEFISRIFPFPNEKVDAIKQKLSDILRGVLSKIKYRESADEDDFTKCLRQEAMKWACILGNTICQRKANEKLLEHIGKLKNNKYYKLAPWWEEWIYCKGLMLADLDTWHTIKNIGLIQNHDNRFLEFLACSKNNINEYLKLITPLDNGTYIEIPANSSINSFLFIIVKHARNDIVLRNILTNFEKLKPRDISDLTAFTIIINHVYSKSQLEEIKKTATLILEKKAYVSITDILHQRETHEASIATSYGANKNLVEHWKWCIQRKLEIRLSQITKFIK